MSDRKAILGIDVGGTYVRMGLVNVKNEILIAETHDSESISDADHGPELLAAVIDGFLRRHIGQPLSMESIALGFPSTVSRDRRRLLQTPNLRGFDNVDIVGQFEARYQIPVFLDKDVNLLLRYDIGALGLNRDETILGFYIGTGLGNAIFMDGKMYLGKNGVAGELGHIPIHGSLRQCGCGNYGCVELEASGKRLTEIAQKEFPGTPITSVFLRHAGEKSLSDLLEWLCIPIAAEVNILDPDAIVIGGGMLRMTSFLVDEFRGRLLTHVRKPLPHDGLATYLSSSNQYAGILGGALLALDRVALA